MNHIRTLKRASYEDNTDIFVVFVNCLHTILFQLVQDRKDPQIPEKLIQLVSEGINKEAQINCE